MYRTQFDKDLQQKWNIAERSSMNGNVMPSVKVKGGVGVSDMYGSRSSQDQQLQQMYGNPNSETATTGYKPNVNVGVGKSDTYNERSRPDQELQEMYGNPNSETATTGYKPDVSVGVGNAKLE